ncbi:hypothetical protein BD324DRAFT_656903 [Kockovaella imperatae]|uniref:Uncharacterized protein n=1 Tax=Kockovaella imperatae TaxID=4999 RepID=A0A1Y1UG85_9TREE|nr:hypothetical protein BD324DRAFT_656903 [Kockovaella imperatae]ORX36524.1 hypothetical protein BD324DRAFT_656903 [Kockovaella imperatae]
MSSPIASSSTATHAQPIHGFVGPLSTFPTRPRRASSPFSDASPATPISACAFIFGSHEPARADEFESSLTSPLTPRTSFTSAGSLTRHKSGSDKGSRRALFYIADAEDRDDDQEEHEEDDDEEEEEISHRWGGTQQPSSRAVAVAASYGQRQMFKAVTQSGDRTHSLKALQRRRTPLYPQDGLRRRLNESDESSASTHSPLLLPFFGPTETDSTSCGLKRRPAIRRKRSQSSIYDSMSLSTDSPLWPPSETSHLEGRCTPDGIPFYSLQAHPLRPRKAATIDIHTISTRLGSPVLDRDSEFARHLIDERRITTSPSEDDLTSAQRRSRPASLTIISEESASSPIGWVRRLSKRGRKAKKIGLDGDEKLGGCANSTQAVTGHKRRFSLPSLRFHR